MGLHFLRLVFDLAVQVRENISQGLFKRLAEEFMPAAADHMELAVRNDLGRVFRPAKRNGAVPVAVEQQDFSGIRGKHRVEIDIPQIGDVIAAHVHPSAEQTDVLGNFILGVVAVDAVILLCGQGRVHQHHPGDFILMAAPGDDRDKTALAAAQKEDPASIHKAPALCCFQYRFQVGGFCQNRHLMAGAAASVLRSRSASAAEIKDIGRVPVPRQPLRVADAGFMVIAQLVREDHQGNFRIRVWNIGDAIDAVCAVLAPDFFRSVIHCRFSSSFCKACAGQNQCKNCNEEK